MRPMRRIRSSAPFRTKCTERTVDGASGARPPAPISSPRSNRSTFSTVTSSTGTPLNAGAIWHLVKPRYLATVPAASPAASSPSTYAPTASAVSIAGPSPAKPESHAAASASAPSLSVAASVRPFLTGLPVRLSLPKYARAR